MRWPPDVVRRQRWCDLQLLVAEFVESGKLRAVDDEPDPHWG